MTSKRYWEKVILDFVDKSKELKSKKEFKIAGHLFVSFPGVFSPIYSSDTQWFAKKIIPYVKSLSFLEIGTGTGAIACVAALNGASKVVATDINPKAIENALQNQKISGLSFPVRCGSVFDPINDKERFDIIFWNHPFGYTNKKDLKNGMLNKSVFDFNYKFLKQFLRQGKKHLSKNGKILLGSSNVAKVNLIKKLAKNAGYKCSLLEKEVVPAYKNRKVKIDVRLYLLTPILSRPSSKKHKPYPRKQRS